MVSQHTEHYSDRGRLIHLWDGLYLFVTTNAVRRSRWCPFNPYGCDISVYPFRACSTGVYSKSGKGRQSVCQTFTLSLAHRVPAAGASSARGRYFECPRPVLRVPAAGTSSASGRQFDYQRLAIRLPRAGNSITKGWQFDSQGLGTRFPAAGNTIPKGWEHDSQGLGTRFPRAGNTIPSGWEHDSQWLDKTKCPYLSGKRAQFSKTLRKFAHKRATGRTIVCFMVAHTTLLIPIPTHATHF